MSVIRENSSSSSNHYELEALAFRIAAIEALMQSAQENQQALQEQAQSVLDAHKEKLDEYLDQADQPVEPDYYPFKTLPDGTTIRELPSGERLFTIPNGLILRTESDYRITAVLADGKVEAVAPGPSTALLLSDGSEFEVVEDFLKRPHEEAGVAGLPEGVSVLEVAPKRYSISLQSGIRVDIHRDEKKIVAGLPSGVVMIGSLASVTAVGDSVETRLQADGRSFRLGTTLLAGAFNSSGIVELSLPDGTDLEIDLGASSVSGQNGTTGCSGTCGIVCEER